MRSIRLPGLMTTGRTAQGTCAFCRLPVTLFKHPQVGAASALLFSSGSRLVSLMREAVQDKIMHALTFAPQVWGGCLAAKHPHKAMRHSTLQQAGVAVGVETVAGFDRVR